MGEEKFKKELYVLLEKMAKERGKSLKEILFYATLVIGRMIEEQSKRKGGDRG